MKNVGVQSKRVGFEGAEWASGAKWPPIALAINLSSANIAACANIPACGRRWSRLYCSIVVRRRLVAGRRAPVDKSGRWHLSYRGFQLRLLLKI